MKQINKVSKRQTFSIKACNYEKVDAMFTKIKIYALYSGNNRNGSHLSKSNIEKAIPTIYNKPIVGEYLENEKNFSDHGASLTVNEQDEFEIVVSTRPYGLIPESAQVYWEDVVESDGSVKEYLVIDGAYLWSGRYPEVETIKDTGFYGQSMEIEIINGSFAFVDGQEVFDITDFMFSGFCMLGVNKESDPAGYVEPCFESSRVVAYSLDKEAFTSQFNQMVEELKFSLNTSKEGGNYQMEDNQVQTPAEDLDVNANYDAAEDIKKRISGTSDEPEGDVSNEDENKDEPVATQVAVDVPVVDEGDVKVDEDVPATDAPDTTDEGDSTVDAGDASTFSISEEDYNTLKSNFEALETEVSTLRKYKRERELGDLKAQFTTQLTEQELDGLFADKADFSIDALQVEIFAMIGKKNYSLEPKQKSNKVQVVSPKVDSENENPYGDIFNL